MPYDPSSAQTSASDAPLAPEAAALEPAASDAPTSTPSAAWDTVPQLRLQDRPRDDRTGTAPHLCWANVWGHLRTITRHKALVMRYCFRVGLYRQGLAHDLSKYSPTEFWTGARYYQGFRSPNAAERIDRGYSEAWLHHKGRNRHHFEYWIDIKGGGSIELVGMPMPTRYVVEMFCDRIAASRVYEGERYTDASPLAYYNLEHSQGTPAIHPDTDALLKRLLELLAERGEDAALREVRDTIVRPRATFGAGGRF